MNKFVHIELNEKKLTKDTLQYIYSIENTYREYCLFIRILDPRIKYGDLNNHMAFLKKRLSQIEFTIDYDTVEYKNKITGFSDNTHKSITELGKKISEKENFSKEIFWASADEEKAYQSISDFDSFEDKIVTEKKLYHVLVNSPFFNVKGWILYYQNLLDVKFPEFSEKFVSGKTIIKYKPFKDKYFLGIETDYQSCKNNFRKGWWEEPEYKLIIFEKLGAKKINKVVTFEKFIHPHFDPPALNFMPFFGSKTMFDVSEIETVFDNGTEKEFLDDGTVRLYNIDKISEDLKRHAYFYYDMLYHTTKEFVKFAEDAFDPIEHNS